MRYLVIPLLALALNVFSAPRASADPPSWSNARSLREEVPELSGTAMTSALVLLVGGAVVVLARRRRTKSE